VGRGYEYENGRGFVDELRQLVVSDSRASRGLRAYAVNEVFGRFGLEDLSHFGGSGDPSDEAGKSPPRREEAV